MVKMRCDSGLTLQGIGDEFGVTRERVRQVLMGCGIDCRAFPETNRVYNRTEVECEQCGKAFDVAAHQVKKQKRYFCGKRCRYEYMHPTFTCDRCGSPMVKKNGRYGPFLACSNYPKCNNIKPLSTGVPCPREGCSGELVQKKTRKGKLFYSCTNYPKCDFATWDRPLNIPCPSCGTAPLYEKTFRNGRDKVTYCTSCKVKFSDEELMKASAADSPDNTEKASE